MHFHSLDRNTFSECYLTLPASGAMSSIAEARALYERMCEAILEHGILPVQEKVYGPQAERKNVLAVRETTFQQAGLDPQLPCTYVDGRPGGNDPVAGIQLWGVVPAKDGGVTVSSVPRPDGGIGRIVRGNGFEMLYLPSISGRGSSDSENSETAQGRRMFSLADEAVQANGHSYTDVVRTWIYLRRILDWYDEFNRVRSDFHITRGLDGRMEGRPFPASTGIQGGSGREECLMDLLTLRAAPGANVQTHPILASRRQNDAFAYGSAFSRAMSLSIEDRQTIFVSGTASIDSDGRTVHADRSEEQLFETLLSIAAVLEPLGGSLNDIALGTLFHKDEKILASYRNVSQQLGVDDLPLVPVRADICRHDLVVEIEAVALVPTPFPK